MFFFLLFYLPSSRKEGQLQLSLNNGHNNHQYHTLSSADSPSRNNLLIHSRSSSLSNNGPPNNGPPNNGPSANNVASTIAPLEIGLAHLDCGSKNNTLTRKTTTTTVKQTKNKHLKKRRHNNNWGIEIF
jgi:hypothetical protein